jgi:hypothetical protein
MLTPLDQCWVTEAVDRRLERSSGLRSILQDQWSSDVCLVKCQSQLVLKVRIIPFINHVKCVGAMFDRRTA